MIPILMFPLTRSGFLIPICFLAGLMPSITTEGQELSKTRGGKRQLVAERLPRAPRVLQAVSELDNSSAFKTGKNEPEEVEVVMRMSKSLFEGLTQQEVILDFPVKQKIQGMAIHGKVMARGKTRIDYEETNRIVAFDLVMPGTANATFSADARVATIDATAMIRFDASQRVGFDGSHFSLGKSRAKTETTTSIGQVCTRRSGPIGKIIQRVVCRVIANQYCEINQSVDEIAQKSVRESFEEQTKDLVRELNATNKFDETLDAYFPDSKTYVIQLASTRDSILAGAGMPGSTIPNLPNPTADLEVWLKTRPVEAVFIHLLAEWEVAHDLLKEFLPPEQAKTIADDIVVQTLDGWSVIRVGHRLP